MPVYPVGIFPGFLRIQVKVRVPEPVATTVKGEKVPPVHIACAPVGPKEDITGGDKTVIVLLNEVAD